MPAPGLEVEASALLQAKGRLFRNKKIQAICESENIRD